MRIVLLSLALLLGAAVAARAQSLEVSGSLDGPAPALLREVLARGRFLLLDRDTILPASFHQSGDLVVVDAEVRLEGRVDGAIAVVGGTLFLRPGARVSGTIASLSGQVLLSQLATTGAVIELAPPARADLSRVANGYRVTLVPPPAPPRFRPAGLLGAGLPTYDRVDGLTLRAGASLALSGDSVPPRLRAELTYRSARREPGGQAAVEIPLGGSWWAHARAGRLTRTNDRWIRDDLTNSLGALLFGHDERDYFASDLVEIGLGRRSGAGLVRGEGFVAPRFVVQASRDRSLESADPWSLASSDWRPNPPVSEGALVSLAAGAQAQWRGATSRFAGDFALEWAPGGWGDFRFASLVVDGAWDMLALWGHRIRVSGHLQEPLAGRALPPQRWTFVGGPATLPTLETAALRGDHVALVHTLYQVPLPSITLPLVGAPTLHFVHVTGTAWVSGDDSPRWPQSLGAGLQFSLFNVTLYIDPAAEHPRPVLTLGTQVGR